MKQVYFWIILLLVTTFVTFYKLGEIPKALYWDEAAFGYYGYSLLQFGTDEYGNKLPFYFKSIGDFKYPALAYLSTLPNLVFGLNEFSARFISAFSGLVVILIIFWIADKQNWLPKSWSFRVVALLLILSSPWYLLFARTAREATLGLSLTMVAFWCLYRYFFEKNYHKFYLFGALIGIILAGLSYSVFRMFNLTLLFGIFGILWKLGKIGSKWRESLMVLGISSVILIGLTVDPNSRLRAENVFNDVDQNASISGYQRSIEVGSVLNNHLGWILSRIYHNKYAFKVGEWGQVYLSHFDLSYLFVEGNPDLPWYTVPDMGLLPLITLPLIILGLFLVGQNLNNPIYLVLIWWVLISAVPVSFTIETPNPIRQFVGFPAFVFLILIGLNKLQLILSKQQILSVVFLILLISSSVYSFKQFFINRESRNVEYTNQGYKEVVNFIGKNQGDYQKISIPGEDYIYFLFWGRKYGFTQDKIKTVDRQWDSITSLGKITFMEVKNCPTSSEKGVLYICSGSQVPANADLKFTTKFNNGNISYSAIEFK